MKRIRPLMISTFLLLAFILPGAANAQAGIQQDINDVLFSFPESVRFVGRFTASAEITSITLEYGVDQLTCGTVVAKAFPEFTPGREVQVEWTWDMRQSGSLPPGASLWWQWQVQDGTGGRFTSPRQSVTWLDSLHNWQVVSGGNINLHYYEGGSAFGNALHDAATQALVRLSRDVGIRPDGSVDIYIYANTDDLREAILYEPAWIGGQAFPEHNIVIIGVREDQIDWGMRTEAHELTHVLVGQLTFTCLGFIPTWLNEGLAMYGEGGSQDYELDQMNQAKAEDRLMSLRALSGNFSEESDRATLSYTQSFSVVDYLIRTYGRERMNNLLFALQRGETDDAALQAAYGFNVNGLEDAWRAEIGATPRSSSPNPTPLPTATLVPTFVPLGGVAAQGTMPAAQPTRSLPQASATQGVSPDQEDQTDTPGNSLAGISKTVVKWALIAAGACLLVVIILVVVIVVVLKRRSRRQA